MLKDVILKLFGWLGLIVASGIIWGATVGWYDETTASTNVYPSDFNKSLYENASEVYSSRLYTELGNGGTSYASATDEIWFRTDAPKYSTD